jgi:sulfatase modifying factor 1
MKSTLAFALLFTSTMPAWAVTIDTVPVGNAGNANDSATGHLYGGVNYAYSIGKYEVTVGQYTAFLNAVAAKDFYNLYSEFMASNSDIAGIARNGSSGSYTYSVIGSPNHPVTYVSWGDAARFANWMHNGQPTGAGPSATEDGAYYLGGALSAIELNRVTRKPDARWFIPSESEWYKAAYYQPAASGGDADDYWTYPMRTNNVPFSDQPPGNTPGNTRVGNFYKNDGIANGYDDGMAVTGANYLSGPNYLTDVGAYDLSPSYYGTYDQGGNVWEWNEAVFGPLSRGERGGPYNLDEVFLRASNRNNSPSAGGLSTDGFRVATVVPEPSTILLAVSAFAAFPTGRRKSVPHNRV